MKTSTLQKFLVGIPTFTAAILLFGSVQASRAEEGMQSDSPPPPATAEAPAVKLSPAMRDILKMSDAKVSPSVLKAYIENYPSGYNPTASQIIALKERGLPQDVIEAMVEHRPQLAASGPAAGRNTVPRPQAPPQPVAPPATAPPAYAPGYDYNYTPSSSVYVIPYTSAYNYYWGYGSAWPWYASFSYWPSYGYGYWPYYRYGCSPYWGSYGRYCGYPGYNHGYYYGHGYPGYGYGRYPGYGHHPGYGQGGGSGHVQPYPGNRTGGSGYGGGPRYVATPRPSSRMPSPAFTGGPRQANAMAARYTPRAMSSGFGGGARPAMSTGFSGGARFGGMPSGGGFRGGGMAVGGGGMRGGRR